MQRTHTHAVRLRLPQPCQLRAAWRAVACVLLLLGALAVWYKLASVAAQYGMGSGSDLVAPIAPEPEHRVTTAPHTASTLYSSPNIVISQVYGGGGSFRNGKYKNSFIELFNRGTRTVNITGWSVQYSFGNTNVWQKTVLSGSLTPGQYYLVQEAPILEGIINLPRQDATGNIKISTASGKVALVNNQTLISSGTACPAGASIVDLVGYGDEINCFEGDGPAPSMVSKTAQALFREGTGCVDTDNNENDFALSFPDPRNTDSELGSCQETDLETIKTAPASVKAGGKITYTITTTNNGPDEARRVEVTDKLPAGLSNVYASNQGALIGNTITWPVIPFLANGQSVTYTVTATAPTTGQTLVNRAMSESATYDPDTDNNTSTTLTTVQAATKSEANTMTMTITNDADCTDVGSVLTVEVEIINSGLTPKPDNPDPEFLVRLPEELEALDCFSSSGDCVVSSTKIVKWNGALEVGEIVTITFEVLVVSPDFFLPQGTPLCVVGTSYFDSNGDETNDASTSVQACSEITCLFDDFGTPLPVESPVSDQKPGAVLIYNFYSSNPSNLGAENTRFSITNTNEEETAVVHLFFVDGDSCSVQDSFICLTPNQTASFLASETDPGVSGYLVAVAVEQYTGCPIDFNYLIGDEYVKLRSGHAANLGAESFASLYSGTLYTCDPETDRAVIAFDGICYNAAPRALMLNNIPSPGDDNSTLLVINAVGGDLSDSAKTIGSVFGYLFDDVEQGRSFTFAGGCQIRRVLSNDFPRTTPRLPQIIPSGHSGWMKFWTMEDCALLGAVINFNPNVRGAPVFNGGHNLHKLTLTTTATFTIPLFPPKCG